MNTDRQLMQQALDALEIAETDGNCYYEATELLRSRLAHCDRCGKKLGGEGDIHTCTPDPIGDAQDKLIAELAAQPEQKPVAWGVFDGPNLHDMFFAEEDAKDMARLKGVGSVVRPLTTPPAAPVQDEYELRGLLASKLKCWHRLTGEEADDLVRFAATQPPAAERNKLAKWMMAKGYATGHGNTIEQLLEELRWQVEERGQDAP
jgi:hypothetical protein